VPDDARVTELRARIAELEAENQWLTDEIWAERIEPTKWVTERCVEEFGLELIAGPFKGLRYPPEFVGGVDALVAKLLGAYESEIHGAVRSMISDAPETVVNVGAAEGYYAVGFALAAPTSSVHAYEIQPEKRQMCEQLAELNGVADRVTIAGECTADVLAKLEPGAAVLLNCEGCELDLVVEAALEGLRHATLLIELHDAVDKAVTGAMRRLLSETHSIELIDSKPRNIDDFPELAPFLGWNNRQIAIWEFRPRPMRWALMRPLP
jgi:hypothetical protein